MARCPWGSTKSVAVIEEEVAREKSRIATLERIEAERRRSHDETLEARKTALAQKEEKAAAFSAERIGRRRLHPIIPSLLASVEFSVIGLAASSLASIIRRQNLPGVQFSENVLYEFSGRQRMERRG